jgi:hypothetical protein
VGENADGTNALVRPIEAKKTSDVLNISWHLYLRKEAVSDSPSPPAAGLRATA